MASHDISLRVEYHSSEGSPPMTVFEWERVDHVENIVTVPCSGSLTFTLDNSYSWMNAKDVRVSAVLCDDGSGQTET